MAQIQPRKPGAKAVRYGVPIALAGLAAATIGLVPALADSGDPDLPKITAEELIAKMAKSDVEQMSGTVKINADLGIPALPGMSGGGSGHDGPFGGGPGKQDDRAGGDEGAKDTGSAAAPQNKLMQLASGEHLLRVATDGPDKQRISVVEDAAEYSVIHNGDEVWAYDSASDSAYHVTLPADAGKHGDGAKGKQELPDSLGKLTPREAAEKMLDAVGESTSVSVDGTAKVAGRDAYQLVIEPREDARSTVDSVRIAVDAENGVPLKFTLAPQGGGEAAVDIKYTEVDFAKPDAGTFDFKPSEGTRVTEHKAGEHGEKGEAKKGERPDLSGLNIIGEDWNSVAEFELPAGAMNGPGGKKGEGAMESSPRAQKLLDSFTDKVKGDFGTGRVFETRLVNALITDDGHVYAGAVTKEGLVEAADKAAE